MFIARGVLCYKTHLQSVLTRLFESGTGRNMAKRSMMNSSSNDNIVWIDMEMTGLNVHTNHILEIACLITDKDLKIVSGDFNVVLHQPEAILESMSNWCKVHHQKTGLINESRLSKIELEDAEHIVLEHLQKYVPKGICPIAGNSVYMDRMFLDKYMPMVNEYLHYRLIDISTIKELVRRWDVAVPKIKKGHVHRALPDIKDSIRELEHYRKYIFLTK